MSKIQKLLEALDRNQRNVRFRDFETLIKAFDFELDRTKGSHRI
jgi:hypothetical protein